MNWDDFIKKTFQPKQTALAASIQDAVEKIGRQQGQFLDSMMLWFMIHGIVESPQEVELKNFLPPLDNLDKCVAHVEMWAKGQRYGTFKVVWRLQNEKWGFNTIYDVPPTFAFIPFEDSKQTE